jgi:dienelactone hydrolase
MLGKLYAKWMFAWETALTTRDSNRVERPLEWGFEHLSDFGGDELGAKVARGEMTGLQAMLALNERIVADPHAFLDYKTPTDFRIEQRFPELYPTNVRPETLEQEREWKRMAEVGELRKVPYLRFTSAVRTPYPENDAVNARWYEEKQTLDSRQVDSGKKRRPKQAMIVMPQWNADAFSHNVLCEMFNKFGIAALRLSKPYHDVRRPTELERSDYAVSANVGRTIAACRQAVADIRCCADWLETQGYEQIGVLGTSLGSAYAFIAAAMDARIRVCAFNHASTQFGDVVWTGQSTRHVKSAFEHAGLTQDEVRAMFAGVSPMTYMEDFAETGEAQAESPKRRVLVIHATYDLTFIRKYSLEVLENFRERGVDFVSKVLPCGHYTTGEWPYKYLDGWYLGSFVWSAFRRLREASEAKK